MAEPTAAGDDPLRPYPSDDQLEAMRDMLHLYGGDAVDLALRKGPLLTGLRKGSRRALGTAFDYIDDGLPVGLVVWSRPDVRRVGERTEIRLVTGDSTQLVIDFPRDVGPRS